MNSSTPFQRLRSSRVWLPQPDGSCGWQPASIDVLGSTIHAIHADGEGPALPRGAQELDLGEKAITPAFVDGHTHLSLSCMRGLVSIEAADDVPGGGTTLRLEQLDATGTPGVEESYIGPPGAALGLDGVEPMPDGGALVRWRTASLVGEEDDAHLTRLDAEASGDWAWSSLRTQIGGVATCGDGTLAVAGSGPYPEGGEDGTHETGRTVFDADDQLYRMVVGCGPDGRLLLGVNQLAGEGVPPARLLKFDRDGSVMWERLLGELRITAIDARVQGRVYVAGARDGMAFVSAWTP